MGKRLAGLWLSLISFLVLIAESGRAQPMPSESQTVHLPARSDELTAVYLSATAASNRPSLEQEWAVDALSGNELDKPNRLQTPRSLVSSLLPLRFLQKKRRNFRRRKINRRGGLSVDSREKSFASSPGLDLTTLDTKEMSPLGAIVTDVQSQITMSADPASLSRLGGLSWIVASSATAAFVGSLRLLGPIIVAQRSIKTMGRYGTNYLRGRYIHMAYSRLEQLYVRYYDLPASFRAMCRIISQLVILFTLSSMFEWMIGINNARCHSNTGGLSIWCVLLWIFSVIGAGYACVGAVAVWGGPLRIQVDADHSRRNLNAATRVFTRPRHILQWLQEFEEWISLMAKPQPSGPRFDPNPILFPATWAPLRIFEMVVVASAIRKCPSQYTSNQDPAGVFMKQFLISVALNDEWYRVFLGEKRVVLGCVVAFSNIIATFYLVVLAYAVNGYSAPLLIPQLVAVVLSGWMNLILFWNRLEEHRREATINKFNKYKAAAKKLLGFRNDRDQRLNLVSL